jgi:hypothetical protein
MRRFRQQESIMTDSQPHPYNELGRRLFAAVVSYELGLRGLDYTLREYAPESVDDFWSDLGEQLLRQRQESDMKLFFGQAGGKPQLVVNNTNKQNH